MYGIQGNSDFLSSKLINEKVKWFHSLFFLPNIKVHLMLTCGFGDTKKTRISQSFEHFLGRKLPLLFPLVNIRIDLLVNYLMCINKKVKINRIKLMKK